MPDDPMGRGPRDRGVGDGRSRSDQDDRDDDELDVPRWLASERPAADAPARAPRAPRAPRADASRDLRRGQGGDPGDEDDGYGAFLDFDGADRRDYVRLPRRSGIGRRLVLGVGVVVVMAVLAVTVGAWWGLRQLDPPGPPGEAVAVMIPEGASAQEIGAVLAGSGVVGNARLFREYVRFRGSGDKGFLAGRYAFNLSSSMGEALAALEKGPIPLAFVQVTLPEGLRVPEIAARLTEVPWFSPEAINAALDGTTVRSPFQPADVGTLEGLVFPDTYQVEEGNTPVDVVTKAVGQLRAVATAVGLEQGAADLGYSPYQILTIASLIEREAGTAEDRPKIARVIYNRIAEDMRLDIDATVAYAVGGKTDPLTESDLEVDSPYNTRLYKGLPPTPIASPGQASIEAALHPAEGDWLYYVLADTDGNHYFTPDYDDFLNAVDEGRAAGLFP